MSMVTVKRNGEAYTNERWIINEKGQPERWFLDHEGDIYVTLRKLREPRPDTTRIITLKQYAFMTEKSAAEAAKKGLETIIEKRIRTT